MNALLQFLIGPVLEAVEKYLPDPQAKAQMQLELLKLQQSSEFKDIDAAVQMAGAQSDVNKVEAASTDPFVARWRPFIGWMCGVGLGVQFLVGPFLTWAAGLLGHPIAFPQLDMGTLLTLLLGMLGLGGLRTIEKLQGKA